MVRHLTPVVAIGSALLAVKTQTTLAFTSSGHAGLGSSFTARRAQQRTSHAALSTHRCDLVLAMAGGEGGDKEWAKALYEASGEAVGDFEKDMKMKGLMKGTTDTNPKLTANQNLIDWLSEKGNVYLSETSSWGEAPHPLAISTETRDEITNESSGRGLLARRDVKDGDELLKIPLSLCLTKASAREALGKNAISSGMNEYLAMACQLIYEKFVRADQSPFEPYIAVLPEVNEVSPTFMWSDDDLNFLQGSPVVAATQSMQMKVCGSQRAASAERNCALTAHMDSCLSVTTRVRCLAGGSRWLGGSISRSLSCRQVHV
jgi:hypothetical protein